MAGIEGWDFDDLPKFDRERYDWQNRRGELERGLIDATMSLWHPLIQDGMVMNVPASALAEVEAFAAAVVALREHLMKGDPLWI